MQPALLNSWIERKEQMARPQKKGLLYFPFDTDFFADLKIRALSARYGSDERIRLYVLWNRTERQLAIEK